MGMRGRRTQFRDAMGKWRARKITVTYSQLGELLNLKDSAEIVRVEDNGFDKVTLVIVDPSFPGRERPNSMLPRDIARFMGAGEPRKLSESTAERLRILFQDTFTTHGHQIINDNRHIFIENLVETVRKALDPDIDDDEDDLDD